MAEFLELVAVGVAIAVGLFAVGFLVLFLTAVAGWI